MNQGCLNAGVMYDLGESRTRDVIRARDLYEAACKGGVAAGCSNLGVIYETGDGVAMNRPRTAKLFKKGCDGGASNGCAGLQRLEGGLPTSR